MIPEYIRTPCCGAEAKFQEEVPGDRGPICDGFTGLFENGLMSLSFYCECPNCGQRFDLFLQGRVNCILTKRDEEDTAMMRVVWEAEE